MNNSARKVLTRLRRGPLTALEALRELGQMRLAARVFELKQSGLRITTEMIEHNGTRIARYRLARNEKRL